jgi:hypothetical protein
MQLRAQLEITEMLKADDPQRLPATFGLTNPVNSRIFDF